MMLSAGPAGFAFALVTPASRGNSSGSIDRANRSRPWATVSATRTASRIHLIAVNWSIFERGPTSSDLWMLDTRRGLVSRFTDDADEDIFPLWARDGNRIIYSAPQNGQMSFYQKDIRTNRRELLISLETVDPHSLGYFAGRPSPCLST